MSKSNSFENSLLLLIFNATPFANMADNAASSPKTQLFVALHTSDPGEAGDQTTSETTYGSYARVAVNRTSGAGGFTVSGNTVAFASDVTFPAGSGGSGTITHFSIGLLSTGAGVILYSGTCTPNTPVGAGITPIITAGTVVTED